jgi:hypothetical protein
MNVKSSLLSAALLAGLGAGLPAFAETAQVVTATGEVVRYEPGQVIVLRAADNSEKRYLLTSGVVVPQDVRVGQPATVYVEPGAGGATVVKRVTTTSVSPDGQTKQTTTETRTEASGAQTTTTTTVSGKVEAFAAGKSVTVLTEDGQRVTYQINPSSTVPGDVVVGKTIEIVPAGPNARVVRTITIE